MPPRLGSPSLPRPFRPLPHFLATPFRFRILTRIVAYASGRKLQDPALVALGMASERHRVCFPVSCRYIMLCNIPMHHRKPFQHSIARSLYQKRDPSFDCTASTKNSEHNQPTYTFFVSVIAQHPSSRATISLCSLGRLIVI